MEMEASTIFLTLTKINGGGQFFFMEMNRNGILLNGIPFTRIPFPFPFADRTNGIPQAV